MNSGSNPGERSGWRKQPQNLAAAEPIVADVQEVRHRQPAQRQQGQPQGHTPARNRSYYQSQPQQAESRWHQQHQHRHPQPSARQQHTARPATGLDNRQHASTPRLPAQSVPAPAARPGPQQRTTKPVGKYIPPGQRATGCQGPKMLEFTVQLVPDLGSIQLIDGSHAAFKGAPPPSHHQVTAVHAYLEHICPSHGASFADVWLDIAHITFAALRLPASKLEDFAALISAAAADLPELTTGTYKICDLALYDKRNRVDAAYKGSDFYYLDVQSTTIDFVNIQYDWFHTLRCIAKQVGGSCNGLEGIDRQHMTVQSFSLRNARQAFQEIKRTVQMQPAAMRCAGLRILQAVDQALESGSGQGINVHGYMYMLQARYPVSLYSSCKQASYHIWRTVEEQRKQKANAAAIEAAVDHVLDQLSLSISQ